MTSISSKHITILAALIILMTGCQFSSKQRQIREWQALNDTIRECSQKIQNIVNVIHQSPYTTEENQKSLLHDIDSIDQHMKQAILNCAERNKDNDLGKYILENYSEE